MCVSSKDKETYRDNIVNIKLSILLYCNYLDYNVNEMNWSTFHSAVSKLIILYYFRHRKKQNLQYKYS